MAAFMGLMPIMWSAAVGADMMKRVAAPLDPRKIGKATDRFVERSTIALAQIHNLFHWEDIMRRSILLVSLALALVFLAVFVASPALADQSSKARGKGAEKHSEKEAQGKQKGKGSGQGVSGKEGGQGVKASQHFSEENRIAIHNYYGDKFRSGRCQPGLAKKGNGCMPPGQEKKWMISRPLPRDVVFYDLPPEVLVQTQEDHEDLVPVGRSQILSVQRPSARRRHRRRAAVND
jgi:hypothetical protein